MSKGATPRDGRPADTGFLLLPLAALVFSTAVLLATIFAGTLIVRPGCDLGQVFEHPCTNMVNTFQLTFNMMILPGTVMFLWLSRFHRRRTRPLDRAVFPAAAEVVDEVLASVRLPRPVDVVLGPRLGGRAFTGGTGTRPYVALGPELLTLPAKGPAGRKVFEAVLRHELAHVQNLDLLRLQFATALRISTRATALFTALLLLAEQNWAEQPLPAGTAAGVVVRTLLIAVAAELVVRAFFRAREHEADLRAAAGDPSGLRAALHGGRERPRGLRERLFARHPAVTARLAGLDDDRGVLALPVGQLLGAGLFAAVALTNTQLFVDVLLGVGLLDRPEAGDVPWVPLLVVAVSAAPVAVFLALGVWRDTRARRIAGRPARPGLIGTVFGVGLLAGMFLAPYPALFHRRPPVGPPLVTGLLVCVVGVAVLCWWLTALAGRSVPAGPVRAILLPAATTMGAALLLLVWETTGWLVDQESGCEFSPAGCGPPATPRTGLALLAEPWAFGPLTLATVTLLVVTLHRYGTAPVGAWWATAVVASGLGLVLVLPRLPYADALASDVWASLHRPLADVDVVLTLQVAVLAAVALAALLPRGPAGPVAAASALLILVTGLAVRVADRDENLVALRYDEYRHLVGLYLGPSYVLALSAVVGVLAARAGAEALRRRREGTRVPRPGTWASEPAGQPADGTAVG